MAKIIHITLPEYIHDEKKEIKKYVKDNNHYLLTSDVCKYYVRFKVLHRTDGPAIEYNNGDKEWWYFGKHHRIDGPAIVKGDRKIWYYHGKLHRVDGPAIDDGDVKYWFKEGEYHRDDGPAIIIDDIEQWYQNGERHRDNGPAFIQTGRTEWWKNGLLHRDDGPAFIVDNRHESWYYDGEHHRENKPACISYNTDREIVGECWIYKGKLHRLDGPAIKYSDEDIYQKDHDDFLFLYTENKTKMKNYFIEDVEYDEEKWNKIVKKIEKSEKKLINKYARRWYEKCDRPGTLIWNNRIKKGWEEIKELRETR